MLEQLGLKAEIGSTRLARGQMIVGPRVRESFWDAQGRSIKIDSLMGEKVAVEAFKQSPDGEMSTQSLALPGNRRVEGGWRERLPGVHPAA